MGTKAHSLAHTKWLCKYHIVFTPKYRRKIIFTQLRESIKESLHCLCKYKGVEILEGHLMPDHVHMLVSIPPKISVANFMGYLRACLETSAFIVTRRHVDKKRLCAAAKTREDCQTVPQRSDGQRMGACTSSPAPCFWRRSEAQNRPA